VINKVAELIHNLNYLHARTHQWRSAGERIALVPTMGALHEGHLELVRLAAALADRVIVSIFVNPAQFAPHEDLGTYPRALDTDVEKLVPEPAHVVYAPGTAAMYPNGFDTQIVPGGPARELEGESRPHFFAGVSLIVTKLFSQTGADIAVFGEKDFQQLKVVEHIVRDLNLPVSIIAAPTSRESDGLARSSRNMYLSPSQRQRAPELYATLAQTAENIAQGVAIDEAMALARERLHAAGFDLDYLELRNAGTLAKVASFHEPLRLLVAARLGATRLIDNIAVRRKN
jgi:pantoate--beta-alanine ligase